MEISSSRKTKASPPQFQGTKGRGDITVAQSSRSLGEAGGDGGWVGDWKPAE